jgi:hypothetical protein
VLLARPFGQVTPLLLGERCSPVGEGCGEFAFGAFVDGRFWPLGLWSSTMRVAVVAMDGILE